MSFGLITAINPMDVPKILKRCAELYRKSQSPYPDAWNLAADEFDRLADELNVKLKVAMENQKRPRARLT
jgi:hypothetical protein